VTEWSKVHDWKSCVAQVTEGSNPSLSAIFVPRIQEDYDSPTSPVPANTPGTRARRSFWVDPPAAVEGDLAERSGVVGVGEALEAGLGVVDRRGYPEGPTTAAGRRR
jgi:hypothetical protein